MIAFLDPLRDRRCHLVGEGHAPVVAVLLTLEARQTSPSLPPKGTDPGPCGISPANRPFSGTAGRGP
jgi:hypothetical protein